MPCPQTVRTRKRLLVSRIFGLLIVVTLLFGANARTASAGGVLGDVLFCVGVLMAVSGFFGRLWCLSYIAGRKSKVLVTTGPYSLCRHPLYFFSLVGGVGLALCTETLTIPLVFLLAFALYYPVAIRGEDRFLTGAFPDYESYKARVPAFFPRWSNFDEGGDLQVSARRLRREIVASAGFVSCLGVIELVEVLHETQVIPTYFFIP
jgi:protein-S-isoprenylcysteine O-methyltransferase Ste14